MGGILSRLYLQSSNYRDDIHKLITCNTPHSGSQIANFLTDPNLTWLNVAACYFVEDLADGDCYGGAINNLRVNSTAIQFDLNGTSSNNQVPVHSVITSQFASNIVFNDYIGFTPSLILPTITADALLLSIFNGDFHDLIVARASQIGGITDVTVIPDQQHSGSVANPEVISNVAALLLSDPSSSDFQQTGYNPPTLTYTTPSVFTVPQNTGFQGPSVNNRSVSALSILNPNRGQVVQPGQDVTVNIQGSPNITNIILIAQYEGEIVYRGEAFGNFATFTYNVGSSELGRKDILAIGYDLNNQETVLDSTHIMIESISAPNSITAYPGSIILYQHTAASVKVSGNFAGVSSEISSLPEVQYQFATSKARKIEAGVIRADELGEDTLTVHYNGLQSQPIPIKVLEPGFCDPSFTIVSCRDITVSARAGGFVALTPSDLIIEASGFCQGPITESVFPSVLSGSSLGENIVTVNVQSPDGTNASCEAIVTIEQPAVPSGWNSQDIGNAYTSGLSQFDLSTEQWEVSSSVYNDNLFSDGLHYAYQTLCSDGEIVSKLESLSGPGWAGLVIREDNSPGARMAGLFSNRGPILRWEYRLVPNNPKQVSLVRRPFPIWLKLVRYGDWIIGYSSPDGVNYIPVNYLNIPMGSCVNVGMATFSYINGQTATAVFSNVSVNGDSPAILNPPEHPAVPEESIQMAVFPNPANGYVTIDLGNNWENVVALSLRNRLGQIMEQRTIHESSRYMKWNIHDLKSGLYSVEVNFRFKEPQVLRFIKME